jgi:hypothetical protein
LPIKSRRKEDLSGRAAIIIGISPSLKPRLFLAYRNEIEKIEKISGFCYSCPGKIDALILTIFQPSVYGWARGNLDEKNNDTVRRRVDTDV